MASSRYAPYPIKWLGAFPDHQHCPSVSLPEFAFSGRSNVGKSTLINSLLGRKGIAFTSSKPGKTQALHLYEVRQEWLLCDLPGYGYAKISKTQRMAWTQIMQAYFVSRPNLYLVFQLVDISIEPKSADLEFGAWLGERQVPMAVVMTKADKQKRDIIEANRDALEQEMLKTWDTLPPMFLTSSNKNSGIEALSSYIRTLVQTS